jgi:hypothetical protein
MHLPGRWPTSLGPENSGVAIVETSELPKLHLCEAVGDFRRIECRLFLHFVSSDYALNLKEYRVDDCAMQEEAEKQSKAPGEIRTPERKGKALSQQKGQEERKADRDGHKDAFREKNGVLSIAMLGLG